MRFLRPLLGLALLAGLLSLVDPQALLATFKQTDLKLFVAALLLAIVANLTCIYRWQVIARELGIQAPYGFLLSAYAQGISANSVLPGGIVGGDAWRSLTIAKKADEGSKHHGVLSVLLDRVSGFWGLTWLSLSAGVVAILMSTPPGRVNQAKPSIGGSMQWFDSSLGQAYLLALLAVALAPMLGRLLHRGWLHRFEAEHHRQRLGKWVLAIIQIVNALPVLKRTLLISIAAQVAGATTFWLCLRSVGIDTPWWLLTALCGGVFLSGILPAALGGFGARELGAVAFITPFGFAKEGVLAGSVLFGLTATIQGVMGLWFWFQRQSLGDKNQRTGSKL
jgi:glycosyltransferase 2 family protein